MPFGARLFIFAFGLVLIPALGQAQQEGEARQYRAAEQQDAPNKQPLGFPVRIIEDNETAKARQRSEYESSQREKDDLVAQKGMNAATQEMNEATQRMALYSLISTVLVGLGTGLLIWTLALTRQANSAARGAVEVTRMIGEAQVRGYLSNYVPMNGNGEPRLNLAFKENSAIYFVAFSNVGASPLVLHSLEVGYSVGSASAESFVTNGIDGSFRDYYLPTSGVIEKMVCIPKDDIRNTWVWVVIRYQDIYGKKWVLQSVSRLVPSILPGPDDKDVGTYVNASPEPGMCVWSEDDKKRD